MIEVETIEAPDEGAASGSMKRGGAKDVGRAPSIEVHVKALRAAIKAIDKVIEGRNTIPILSNVMIVADEGRMEVTGTDLDTQLVVQVDCTVSGRFATTIAQRPLRDMLNKLDPDATLSLELGCNVVVARAGRATFKLATLPVEDFPVIVVGDTPHQFEVAAFDLATMIDAVAVAMSTEETRYYLNGIYMHAAVRAAAENPAEQALMVLRVAATDGHRLARFDIPQPDGSGGLTDGAAGGGVIIPRKTVGVLAAAMDGYEGAVGVSVGSRMIAFDWGSMVLTSKLIDGEFPDYTRVIPSANDKVVTCDRAALASAIGRVMVMSAGKDRAVRFDLSRDVVRVSVISPELGEAVEEVPCDYAGDVLTIGFNGGYLLGLLNHIQGSDVVWKMLDAAGPTLLLDANVEARRLYVVMPMRV